MQRSSTAGVEHLFSIATLTAILLSGACTSSNSLLSPEDEKEAANRCTDPQNPYNEGTGHYAGYEWAEEKNPTVKNSIPELQRLLEFLFRKSCSKRKLT